VAGAAADPLDRGCQLWPVGRGAVLDVVVQDDAVVVVGDLGLFCRAASNAALGSSAGVNALFGAGAGPWVAVA
jgi:hypothetical protein